MYSKVKLKNRIPLVKFNKTWSQFEKEMAQHKKSLAKTE